MNAHTFTGMNPACLAGLIALWAVLTGGLIVAGLFIFRDRARYKALRKPRADEVWEEINPPWMRVDRVLVLEVSRNGKQLWWCNRSDNFETPAERDARHAARPELVKMPRIRQPSMLEDTPDFVARYQFLRSLEDSEKQ